MPLRPFYPRMTTNTDHLNRILGDSPHIGWVPDQFTNGTRLPRYRWMKTEDLVYPAQDVTPDGKWQGFSLICGPDSLPIAKGPSYHFVRQYPDENRWCIAKWDAPIPRDQWIARYGHELQWPQQGMWLVTSLVFDEHVTPSEALTREVIAAVAQMSVLNFNDYVNISQGILDKSERDHQNLVNDLIDDACMQYDSVPGKRGYSTSWGGI